MFHTAVKVIIVTEKFLQERVCSLIESGGGKGYTLVSAGGKGLHHLHSTDDKASVIEGFGNIKIEVIVRDRSKAEAIAETVMQNVFREYPGIIYLENVEIWREERF